MYVIKMSFEMKNDIFKLMNSFYGKAIRKKKFKMSKNINHIKMSFWDEKEVKKLFQELPFYNASVEKPYIKHLNNIDLLHELPF